MHHVTSLLRAFQKLPIISEKNQIPYCGHVVLCDLAASKPLLYLDDLTVCTLPRVHPAPATLAVTLVLSNQIQSCFRIVFSLVSHALPALPRDFQNKIHIILLSHLFKVPSFPTTLFRRVIAHIDSLITIWHIIWVEPHEIVDNVHFGPPKTVSA